MCFKPLLKVALLRLEPRRGGQNAKGPEAGFRTFDPSKHFQTWPLSFLKAFQRITYRISLMGVEALSFEPPKATKLRKPAAA